VRALPSRLPSNALSALSRWNIDSGQRWRSGRGRTADLPLYLCGSVSSTLAVLLIRADGCRIRAG
jgi:hypothetical protein